MNNPTKIQFATLAASTPHDIICNGFSMKQTIKEVLDRYEYYVQDRSGLIDEIAEEITESFAIKMRLKQG